MNISGEDIGLGVGVVTFLGLFVSSIKFVVTMREHIKTLFKKVEEIQADKDADVRELKDSIRSLEAQMLSLKDAYVEANQNLVKIINDNHIKLLDRIS